MVIKIPSTNKKFSQTNHGNILGNLWSTFGIDLTSNAGAIRVGNRMKILTKTGDTNATNLGIPTSFTPFGGLVFCIGGTRIFKSNKLTPDMVFAEDASTGALTSWSSDTSDLTNFNSTLVGLNGTTGKIYSLDAASGGTWTDRGSICSTAGLLVYFKKFNRLYALDYGNAKINSVDTAWSVSTTAGTYSISFTNKDDGGTLRCIAASSDKIWIGTLRTQSGGTSGNSNPNQFSSVYEWDGISAQVTREHKIPAQGVMSMVIENDVPLILDSNGIFRQFNGSGFSETGRLPLQRGENLLAGATPYWTDNFINPRGLAVSRDDTILAMIGNRTQFDYSANNRPYENLPSGIWEFDKKGSVHHKHPITYMGLTSTSVTDHGQNRILGVGSLNLINPVSTSAYGISSLFTGAQYYTDASSSTKAVFTDAPIPTNLVTATEGQKYGYFVTPFIQSQEVKDVWQKVWLKFKRLLASNDKIVLKYRATEETAQIVSITWASETTFTTSTDLSNYVGYEVEGILGTGSGKCSHIVSVSGSGTYTVTLDETYTGVGTSTAKVRVQNWKRAGEVTSQTVESWPFTIGIHSERIQIKVCMQFTGDDEVFELNLLNKVSQPLA